MHTTKTVESGSITLGIVFGLGMLALGIAASTLTFSTNAVVNNSIAGSGVRALVTADSAGREGIYRLIEDYNADGAVDEFTETEIPLLNATDAASVKAVGTWPIYEIRSSSANPRVSRNITTEVNLFPSGFAFDQAVYTHGSLTIGGSAEINGDVYATNEIDFNGGAPVNGDASTAGAITPTNQTNVTGESTNNHPVIEPPTIDIGTFIAAADYSIITNTASNDVETLIIDPLIDNVIIYTDTTHPSGVVSLNTNATLNGMLIVEDDLKLTGGITITAAPTTGFDVPVAIYVKGDFELAGDATVHGIVFVEGDVKVTGTDNTIDGSLLSVNNSSDLVISGDVSVTYNQGYADAWTDLFDTGLLDGAPPEISDWHEE